ncbi:MAG: flagellar basal body rod protein FlgC [Clostridiales bacterium]|jgi:flagellar basal-body rod protein FlgC|nr:flagellar basal body rod protein FlgC [Clostridiales bacterium]
MFNALNISAAGLTAQRLRMDVISQNIANINTTRTPEGGPYRGKHAVFQEIPDQGFSRVFQNTLNRPALGAGVRVSEIAADETPGVRVYEPGHPDADTDGYVSMPNVNIIEEMVNMISASRSYEANVTALNSSKSMIAKTMEIGR